MSHNISGPLSITIWIRYSLLTRLTLVSMMPSPTCFIGCLQRNHLQLNIGKPGSLTQVDPPPLLSLLGRGWRWWIAISPWGCKSTTVLDLILFYSCHIMPLCCYTSMQLCQIHISFMGDQKKVHLYLS